MEYETQVIDGKSWRVCVASDEPHMIGTFRCNGCGQTIKKKEHLDQHLQTMSHKKGMEWLEKNRPDRTNRLRFLIQQKN